MNYKRAISPVIATALLLVVAVVSVVGFQTFFNTYSTGLFSKVETQSESSVANTQIDTISGGMLYFKSGFEEIEIQSVKVNGNNCYVSGLYINDLNSIPISNCTNSGENDVVLVTNKGVYEKKIYKSNADYSAPCPTEYIIVPGNADLNTSNFCVMKFEAKNVSNIATSQGALTPWVSITWQQARANCSALGNKYHLITDNEWLTIAHNIEMVSNNWNSTVVGSGYLFSGHNDFGPGNIINATENDSDGYYGTADSLSSCDGVFNNYVVADDTIIGKACAGQKRTLLLSNNEVIWDLSGNVWEWVNDSILASSRYPGGEGWMSYSSNDGTGKITSLIPLVKLPSFGWNANQSMGRYYDGFSASFSTNSINESPDFCTGYCSSTIVLGRSGTYSSGSYTGIFTFNTNYGPSHADTSRGFRCAYTP